MLESHELVSKLFPASQQIFNNLLISLKLRILFDEHVGKEGEEIGHCEIFRIFQIVEYHLHNIVHLVTRTQE